MRYFVITHAKNAHGKHNEMINLDDQLRTRYSTDAAIILDYQDKKVIKCRFRHDDGTKKTFDELNTFYKQHYASIIERLELKYQVLGDLDIKALLDTVAGDDAVVITTDDIVEQEKAIAK